MVVVPSKAAGNHIWAPVAWRGPSCPSVALLPCESANISWIWVLTHSLSIQIHKNPRLEYSFFGKNQSDWKWILYEYHGIAGGSNMILALALVFVANVKVSWRSHSYKQRKRVTLQYVMGSVMRSVMASMLCERNPNWQNHKSWFSLLSDSSPSSSSSPQMI